MFQDTVDFVQRGVLVLEMMQHTYSVDFRKIKFRKLDRFRCSIKSLDLRVFLFDIVHSLRIRLQGKHFITQFGDLRGDDSRPCTDVQNDILIPRGQKPN